MPLLAAIHATLTAQRPQLQLSPDLFGNDPALRDQLLRDFWEQDGLIRIADVSDYAYDEADGTIAFAGRGVGGPFDGLTLTLVEIRVREGVPQLRIDAEPAPDWTLPLSFPALGSPILQLLTYQLPALYWASYAEASGPAQPSPVVQGFYFEGELDLENGPLALLRFLFPQATAPLAWGRIGMRGSRTATVRQFVPTMALTVDASQNTVALGPFVLHAPELTLSSEASFNYFDARWQADGVLNLRTFLEFQDTLLYLNARILDLRHPIVLSAGLDQPLGASLLALSNWVGAQLQVPQFDIQLPNDLSLKDLALTLDLTTAQKVTLISVEVGTAPGEKWTLWGESVFLEDISLRFQVRPGAAGTPTVVEGEVAGVVGGWLSLQAGFSSSGNYRFFGGLARPVSVREFYAYFIGEAPDDLPDLEIENLDFTLELDRSTGTTTYAYGGELEIESDWTVLSQPVALTLRGLVLQLSHAADGQNQFRAGVTFDLADYAIGLEGAYATDQGWTLSGSLSLADAQEPLSGVVQRIDASYPATGGTPPAVPPFLRGWQVSQLAADFNTRSKDLNFVATVHNSQLPALELGVGVHLLHHDDAFTKQLDAVAAYRNEHVDVAFDLKISQETQTQPTPRQQFTLAGAYRATKPPTLREALLAAADALALPVALPAEVALDAAVTGLAVQVQQTNDAAPGLEVAGTFHLTLGSTGLDVYLAYTNAAAYDAAFTEPALVDGKAAYVLGVVLGGIIDLSQLPLVGRVPGFASLRLDALGFYYTNAAFTKPGQQLYFRVPEVTGATGLQPKPGTTALSHSGFNLTAVLTRQDASGQRQPLLGSGAMPLPLNSPPAPDKKPTFAGAGAKPSTPIKWLDVHKSFGPVSVEKVGLNYGGGLATLGISAGFSLGGFTLALEGLSVSFPMPLPGKKAAGQVQFDLQGMGLGIKTSSFELSGFFLKDTSLGITSYYGQIIVQVGKYGLKAIGGYSPNANPPSLFLYANINVPLGGPPYFFVSGLAGGFGVNSRLVLPTMDELSDCLLLPNHAPPQPGSPTQAMQQVLPALKKLVVPQAGQYWIAAGIQFTAFQMIDAFALVTVAFGVDLQIGLLGMAAMTVPKLSPYPIAYVEVELMASFTPSAGLLAFEGRVAPASFIYGGFVHLTGGFAFYLWFSGPHQGDFVVSLGGYPTNYRKPAHYPTVPRLGLSFGLGPFQVLGQAYFALTPSMLMAGLQLQATWSSGPIRAWLEAGADFLLGWAPLHYEARAYVLIGVAVDLGLLTVHAQVGANLDIWGPEFGGRAEVDLDVVSFSINFGAPKPLATVPLSWAGFQQRFLPAPTAAPVAAGGPLQATPASNIIKASVSAGLLQQDVPGYHWVVDPDHFALETNSVVPANAAHWNGTALPAAARNYQQLAAGAGPFLTLPAPDAAGTPQGDEPVWAPTLHVAPMKASNIRSDHRVELRRRLNSDGPGQFGEAVGTVLVQPLLLNASTALWGPSAAVRQPNSAGLLPRTLAGLRIMPLPRHPAQVTDVPLKQLLYQAGHATGFSTPAAPAPAYQVQTTATDEQLRIVVEGAAELTCEGYRLSALDDEWVRTQRAAVLEELYQHDFATLAPRQVQVEQLARVKALADWPVVAQLGQ